MMTCHTKNDRGTWPPRAIDQRYGVKESFHEDMNYDGQGKSQQQETDDSMTMIVLAFFLAIIIGGLIVAGIALAPSIEWAKQVVQ